MFYRVVIAGSGALALALVAATPARASEASYLALLQPKYAYLTTEQLLDEGSRVCAAIDRRTPTHDVVSMVQRDLGVSVSTALDIMSVSVSQLDC